MAGGKTRLGTRREDYGHVAYITTDGGTAELAPDGVLRPARLVRIEFAVEGWRATLMAAPKDAAPR